MKSNTDSLSSFIRFIQLKSLRARTQGPYLTWVRRVAWKFRHGDIRPLLHQGQESSVPPQWLHILPSRASGCPLAPSQTRTCGTTASGSSGGGVCYAGRDRRWILGAGQWKVSFNH